MSVGNAPRMFVLILLFFLSLCLFISEAEKNQRHKMLEYCGNLMKKNLVQASLVPAEISELVPAAQQWGCPDPECAKYVAEKMLKKDKKELIEKVGPKETVINSWLGSFQEDLMLASDEVKSFYALRAVYNLIKPAVPEISPQPPAKTDTETEKPTE